MKNNTAKSFFDKWKNMPSAFFQETLREGSETQRWILERNGFRSLTDFSKYLKNSKRILDAGCGNGRVTALLRLAASEHTQVIGIDLVSANVAKENLRGVPLVHFESRDLLEELSDLGKFDFIYCQEVLHHTVDPSKAFHNLSSLLNKGGEIAIYVYKKKAPAREYVDDYIRSIISSMSYENAMNVCREITNFGKILSETNLKVNLPEVSLLEIPAGEYNIQRLLYLFFVKCYWNPDVSFEENVLVNYDWYHPQDSTRHTIEEVESWFNEIGLKIIHRNVDFYGITIRGLR